MLVQRKGLFNLATIHFNDFTTIFMMALALGMDAFSVGLALGLQQLRLKRIALIGFTVGIFHVLMPFIGIILGSFMSTKLEGIAVVLAGILLCGIGAQMIFQTFQQKSKQVLAPVGFGLVLFAISVSLDSFPVGLSLGLSGAVAFFILIIFGIVTCSLTWLALLIGRRANHLLGAYSEVIGGSILFGFGLLLLF